MAKLKSVDELGYVLNKIWLGELPIDQTRQMVLSDDEPRCLAGWLHHEYINKKPAKSIHPIRTLMGLNYVEAHLLFHCAATKNLHATMLKAFREGKRLKTCDVRSGMRLYQIEVLSKPNSYFNGDVTITASKDTEYDDYLRQVADFLGVSLWKKSFFNQVDNKIERTEENRPLIFIDESSWKKSIEPGWTFHIAKTSVE